ncbi:aromatic ring-hydroxylating dioxygenase subunit alpha [Nostoc sp. FACHB-87]|uniref:aromatic ring-hydroxylating dioxygenase subunit alpha n=1 Tax=Nostocales TaxID=1161 RepID=UPI00168720AC|nr:MULTISPECIES: Rieske 2Fe-2S domain-containing protein [Nostocales]MBD2301183.1 aromatic ring-hydroxylating dioxygenase subunit alpha [Nostoc sp. FACHB-190]MBD2456166.1 aromatic ring-hydroxylating dioxygenase subunit alpha [Nostoc sp. FACHB-87]MBD2473917.1 aromatic ring-hydroxylating dioxygenase subunit alpha [Anabaena sp. FACHB-83]MBD2490446.1 aromatic ring-hydroxylating dioxygenase subunit alpha [Aulosira sp. FACHB-615]
MTVNSQNHISMRKPKIFNNPERFIEGWYWVMPSQNLRIGEVKPVTILGRNLVVYRGQDKRVVICDAYCPHMGAHLAEGRVEGSELRCFFHHWKFNEQGICVEIPCLDEPLPIKLKTWPTDEEYGMIWIWTGETPQHRLPYIPDLAAYEFDVAFGFHFVKNCHPNVVMLNAIDAQHFNTVHQLGLDIVFDKHEYHHNAIIFTKITDPRRDFNFTKLIRVFSKHPITYSICYWYGSTNIVTLGPDFLGFHIMFALRLLAEGKTEGRTIFMMKKRRGILGRLFNKFALWLAKLVGTHFVKGDSKIFQTIRFDLKTPIKADHSIVQFINHVEKQKPLMWGTWQLARVREAEPPENLNKWRDDLTND